MSATQVPLRPVAKGTLTKLWLGLILLVILGVGLAYAGTRGMQGITTEGGTFVRTLEEGSGDPIGANDGAFVIYRGTLEDGQEFDSSGGQPVPMLASRLIPGFSEALLQMREGGSYRIRIPAAQAYGATPPPQSVIPADADLYFDVSIAQIVRDAALMAEAAPPPRGE